MVFITRVRLLRGVRIEQACHATLSLSMIGNGCFDYCWLTGWGKDIGGLTMSWSTRPSCVSVNSIRSRTRYALMCKRGRNLIPLFSLVVTDNQFDSRLGYVSDQNLILPMDNIYTQLLCGISFTVYNACDRSDVQI